MKLAPWLLVLAVIGVLAYAIRTWRRRWQERERASEERFAAFMAQAKAATPVPPAAVSAQPVPMPDASLPQQRLLFEAAAKAGEAGEPVLSIQLYARLLSRFPQTSFATQARSAIEAQKQKLAKA